MGPVLPPKADGAPFSFVLFNLQVFQIHLELLPDREAPHRRRDVRHGLQVGNAFFKL